MKLTRADKAAVQNGDSSYLVNKGIRYYSDQDYEVAIDYLHLAAVMGNSKAIGYLGSCYMYGKGVPEESDLGLSYLRIGMDNRDIDSLYRMGKLYCDGDVLEKDPELGIYYYETALAELLENYTVEERVNYPDLFYALSQEKLPEGGMEENLATSYLYLLIAEAGYTILVKKGFYGFEEKLKEVQDKKMDDRYDEDRKTVQKEFEEEYLLS